MPHRKARWHHSCRLKAHKILYGLFLLHISLAFLMLSVATCVSGCTYSSTSSHGLKVHKTKCSLWKAHQQEKYVRRQAREQESHHRENATAAVTISSLPLRRQWLDANEVK